MERYYYLKENLVHPVGFEPTTFRSVAERSIQLSYGCNYLLMSKVEFKGIRKY